MLEARDAGTALLVEATSNQVNQFGGYTGHTTRGLRALPAGHRGARRPAGGTNLDRRRPPRPECLARRARGSGDGEGRRARARVRGERLPQDPPRLLDGLRRRPGAPARGSRSRRRAARLAAVAEGAWRSGGGDAPVYVIGTEVPTPGGATEELAQLAVTTPEAASATIEAHREAFARAGLTEAWPRIVALVVQPGVEFDHHKVVDYRPHEAEALSAFIGRPVAVRLRGPLHRLPVRGRPQGPGARSLRDPEGRTRRDVCAARGALGARRHRTGAAGRRARAGPAQTRRRRDARRPAALRAATITARADSLDFDLQYSLSDRIRYYWPYPEVQHAVAAMLDRLGRRPIPLALLSQFLPRQYDAVREGRIAATPEALVREGVAAALRPTSPPARAVRRRPHEHERIPGPRVRGTRIARRGLDRARDLAAAGQSGTAVGTLVAA